ncbi:MAG: glycyl-radical enzyme activating protein [Acidobacteriota bacterium]|nr:glycyl-radical enzyme activating protein [Acidobacteriota bacterium]
MIKGIVFDIKRYAIHDGPGIRTTVFFKGCPLRCLWCHNPEGQEIHKEILLRRDRCVAECTVCLDICPQKAIRKSNGVIQVDNSRCDCCGLCVEACVYEVLEVSGREVTVEEVLEEVEKDQIFFEESGGGVTFSGGEPLMQPDFLDGLLKECKKRKIHTVVDTSGCASFKTIERIAKNVDLFLYDIKIMNDKKHKHYTGVSNKSILKNLKNLLDIGKRVVIRIPLIEGINDGMNNIEQMGRFLKSLKKIKQINLLPYHKGGGAKYKRLQREDPSADLKRSPDEQIKSIMSILTKYGFSVKVGG